MVAIWAVCHAVDMSPRVDFLGEKGRARVLGVSGLSTPFARRGTIRRSRVFTWFDDIRTGWLGGSRGILTLGGDLLFKLTDLFCQRCRHFLLLQ
jgi:hypothetical protein